MTEAEKACMIVKEMLGRSVAGVFALCDSAGSITTDWKTEAEWTLNLGLAAFLQYAAFDNVRDTHQSVAQMVQKELLKTYQEPYRWQHTSPDELQLLTTDVLLAELFRLQTVTWVLSLRREAKNVDSRVWNGAMWMGSGLLCMGLAAMLQRLIADQMGMALDDQLGHDPLRPLEFRSKQILESHLGKQPWDSKVAMGTFSYLMHEAARLREKSSRTESSLQHFMDPRPPDAGHSR